MFKGLPILRRLSAGYRQASRSDEQKVLWLGAHKTGTTFLQGMLDSSAEELSAEGISYENLTVFRTKFLQPLFHPTPDSKLAPASDFRRGVRMTILFDENIIGYPQQAISDKGILYPQMEVRLDQVLNHLQFAPDRIILGIRSMETWLPSLYGQLIKTYFPNAPLSNFVKKAVQGLSWLELIDRICLLFPGVPIHVYKAEDLRANEAKLLSLVTGIPSDRFQPARHRDNIGISQAAMLQIFAIRSERKITPDEARSLIRKFPKGKNNSSFDPFSDNEKSMHRSVYAGDLEDLRKNRKVTLLDLGEI